MKRLLLYSPDVVGHPRVYCRVIADAMAAESCELFVAMGFTDAVGLKESPDILPLASRAGVQLLDTRDFSGNRKPHLTAEELVGLQSRFSIDTTLFIEAEKSNAEFARIAAKKLRVYWATTSAFLQMPPSGIRVRIRTPASA